jgi:hypothetical protein
LQEIDQPEAVRHDCLDLIRGQAQAGAERLNLVGIVRQPDDLVTLSRWVEFILFHICFLSDFVSVLLFVFLTIAATNAAKWLPTGLPWEPASKAVPGGWNRGFGRKWPIFDENEGKPAVSGGEVTAASREVTVAPREVTVAPPEVTATPPEVTAALPEVTAAPPEVTAAPPVVTATPPEVTAPFSEARTAFASPAEGFSAPALAASAAGKFAGFLHSGKVERMLTPETFPENFIPIPVETTQEIFQTG